MTQPTLLLCGGLQSSGTTLVSWCFLQRHDTDGVLDAFNDILFEFPESLPRAPYLWCKFTIGCFAFRDVRSFYEDAGFWVRPLLVVRDVRDVWRSLVAKPYGRNGLTAEDPPLRLRLRRFKDDWQEFHREGWPVLRYEDLLEEPSTTLHHVCSSLRMPWDDGMMNWPKPKEEIAFPINGNETFLASMRDGLTATVQFPKSRTQLGGIPHADLDWLEEEFLEYNRAYRYELQRARDMDDQPVGRSARPSLSVTRRAEWDRQRMEVGTELFAAKTRLAAFDNHRLLGPILRWRRRLFGDSVTM